ncbi:MAG: DUF3048 domain-containing protein [Acetatifactor sp.]|nr:DUF3048 domain-containing protein [Acetatifactor sp.]
MKKSRIWLVLAAAVLLCACSQNNSVTPNPTDTGSGLSQGSVGTVPEPGPMGDSQTDLLDDTKPPREGMVRSLLTNEWVDADVAQIRPIAVIIPNEIGAVPHYNLSEASVVYEANVEGRMSRLMALYENWDELETIGNIRSLRTYFAYWSFEWDAFLVHSGGPYFIDDLIAEPTTQNIDDHVGANTAAFFRDTSRSMPHNLYTTGQGLLKAINNKGYSLTYRGLTDKNHFHFTNLSNQNTLTQYGDDAKSAVYIDMSGCYPLTRCYFEYNEADGLYYRSQYLSGGTDGPHIDAVTGKQLAFKNILVQNIVYEELGDDGYMVFGCHDNSMDGWYFTNGKGIHVNWEKSSDYGATRYYDDDGNEILMNTGKTMICIVLEGSNFTFR